MAELLAGFEKSEVLIKNDLNQLSEKLSSEITPKTRSIRELTDLIMDCAQTSYLAMRTNYKKHDRTINTSHDGCDWDEV